MSDSITVEGDKVTHRSNEGSRQTTESKGKVVRLPESQLEAHKGSVTINQADGGGINDIRTVRVEAPTRSGLPEEFGTIQDPHGRICANLKEVTGNHSIEYKGVRAKISTLETMGVVARDANGELMILGDDGEAPVEKETPLSQTENLRTNQDQGSIQALNERVGESTVNAFMGNMIASLIDGHSGQSSLSDFAQSVGESEKDVYTFASEYLANVLDSGIDYAVRQSGGTVTGDQIREHIPKLSKGYQKSLMLSLHLNNLSEAKHLLRLVRSGEVQ